MAKKDKPSVHPLQPQEVREDKPEEERKHRVLGENWCEKAAKLDAIFNFVAAQKTHFVTLDSQPHTDHFDGELADASEYPTHFRPLRKRYYWGTIDLDGYKDGDPGKAELRTERKIGKGYWEQTLKIGGSTGKKKKTLIRGEYKRALDGFGTNIDIYPSKIRRDAKKVLDDKVLKPLARLEGQSKPVLYHPDGNSDVIFEIKFDKCKGFTFDGHEEDIVEVEIEVKEIPDGFTQDDIEELLDKSEKVLYDAFQGDLEPIYEAKPSALFRHLVEWRDRDKKEFEKAYKALPGDKWADWTPS